MVANEMIAVTEYDLIPGFPIPADIFIHLPTEGWILVARKGSKSSLSDLHVSQSQTVSSFFIKKTDYLQVVDQNVRVANVMLRRPEVSVLRKSDFLGKALDSVLRELREIGFQPSLAEKALGLAKSLIEVVRTGEELRQVLEAIEAQQSHHLKDSIAVASISVMMGRMIGWPPASLEILALGGYLSNVGYGQLPPELLNKSPNEMSMLELTAWHKHPQLGFELVAKIKSFPSEVSLIVLEHHENSAGTGFPLQKKESTLHQYSKVVAIAAVFAELIIKSPHNPSPMTAAEAIHFIERKLQVPYNASCWLALKRSLDLK